LALARHARLREPAIDAMDKQVAARRQHPARAVTR
jgi:hypothetical protein